VRKYLYLILYACSQRRKMKEVQMLAQGARVGQRSHARAKGDVLMRKEFLRDENGVCGRRRGIDLCLTTLSLVIMAAR
jgi:hypothetical protein